MTRCDIVLAPNRGVYINGTLIENLMAIDLHHDSLDEVRVVLELHPTSIVFGDVPKETVEAMHDDRDENLPTVDIQQAIEKAKARARRALR